HKLSDYSLEWHCKIGKTDLQTNKLWKASRAVINQVQVGYECLKYILSLDGESINNTADGDGTKYTRDEDMLYLYHFDNKHRTPYRIERNHIDDVLIDGRVLDKSKILSEHRDELGQGFLFASTDYWSNPHGKEQFGALVVYLTAEKLCQGYGYELCMSRETAKSPGKTMVPKIFCCIKTVVHKHI
ncbi:hypothetical protein ACHAW6_010147, partial [Cyclotella cf. meneghiniana]